MLSQVQIDTENARLAAVTERHAALFDRVKARNAALAIPGPEIGAPEYRAYLESEAEQDFQFFIADEQRHATNAPIIAAYQQARERVRADDAKWLADARRWRDRTPEQVAAEESQRQAEGDAEHAAWLASGEPDLLASWQAKRAAERDAAETERDAIEKAARKVRMAADSTDAQVEAADAAEEAALAEWHSRQVRWLPNAKKKAAYDAAQKIWAAYQREPSEANAAAVRALATQQRDAAAEQAKRKALHMPADIVSIHKGTPLFGGASPAPMPGPYKDEEDSDIARLNATHAVLPIGGKTRVVTFGETDDFPGRQTITMVQTLDDFVSLNNKYDHAWINEKGEEKHMPLGIYWRSSRQRRQYDGGMAFMPKRMEPVVGDKLNLWQGYGVQPVKPDGKSGAEGCAKFLWFVHDVICNGDAADYAYLIKREATILQKRVRSEIALGLRSEEEGVGKGFYERVMGRLLGTHAMQINNPRHVIGNFNPHLETLLRLTADEALFVGNHEHRNALFGLITESKLTIEPKNCGVYSAPNYLNLSITSNAAHFIPVSGTARRFFVPTVSSKHKQDFNYFRDIETQLTDEAGYEALLWHLLHEIDLTDFDVRKVPRTAGLLEQATYSRRGVDGLVELICNTGMIPGARHDKKGFSDFAGDTGFHHFIDTHRDRDIAGRSLLVIRRLADDWGCKTGEAARYTLKGKCTRGILWPELAALRAKFETKFGPQKWADTELKEWPDTPAPATLYR